MHYHINMITVGTTFGKPDGSTRGDKLITCRQNPTFLKKKTYSARLEPGQTWTLTVIASPTASGFSYSSPRIHSCSPELHLLLHKWVEKLYGNPRCYSHFTVYHTHRWCEDDTSTGTHVRALSLPKFGDLSPYAPLH